MPNKATSHNIRHHMQRSATVCVAGHMVEITRMTHQDWVGHKWLHKGHISDESRRASRLPMDIVQGALVGKRRTMGPKTNLLCLMWVVT